MRENARRDYDIAILTRVTVHSHTNFKRKVFCWKVLRWKVLWWKVFWWKVFRADGLIVEGVSGGRSYVGRSIVRKVLRQKGH